jgi:mono/diheme cytochrome c family protein
MMMRVLAVCLLVAAGIFGVEAQQQTPTPAEQPSSQPAPKENKAEPPTTSSPDQRQTDQGAQTNPPNSQTSQDAMIRTFLGLGAPPDHEAEKRGQSSFVPACGFCHGTNATGGAQGPNLVRSTLVLHDQGTGKELGPMIHAGRPNKGMPPFPDMTEAQVHDIAQFLLGRTQAAANRMQYKIQNIVTGDPKAGQTYFQSHCADCHSPSGDLVHIATKYDAATLQGRFLYPSNYNPYGFGPPPDPRAEKHVRVTLPSGETYAGVLARIDDFSVALRESSGVYRSWIYDDVNGIRVEVQDPLAQHLALLRHYSDADMHNILAYLETLK